MRSKLLTAGFVLLAATKAAFLSAQTPQSQAAPSDVQKPIEQLIQQNQRLEQQNNQLMEQNRQLMEQIKSLRPSVAKLDGSVQPTSVQNSPPPVQSPSVGASPQAGGQTDAQDQTKEDDSSLLPEASGGHPAIFGEFNPGRGFTVGKGEYGELNLSGYMAVRYLNQLPPDQSARDHLGRPLPVNPRNDFQFHRVMLFSQGWLFSPKFQYSTFLWTVQDTNQVAVGGALYYNFGKYLTLGAGWNAYPGTQSLQGSHPYWESYDRVMADEFFRPFFSQGVFAQGDLLPRLQYRVMVGNNNSNLDVPATKLDRDLSAGFALTWLPTTGEFGPRGAFGDYERHEKLATRFNLAYTYSPEDRQSAIGTAPSNTTLRLTDSLNVFDTGALANGVTVEHARYQMVSAGVGMKYRGFWLQGEGYGRKLDHFTADGKLPVGAIRDYGFYVQMAHMIVPNRIELYGATSYVLGAYAHPKEFIVGSNYYPWNTRNLRLNAQLINVDHSPVSSTFGFYTGQITGQVFSLGFTAMY
ncbi:MAG: bZIP transcription factor [Bryobacteraceae bacterium]